MQLNIFESKEELAKNFARHFTQIIADRDACHIALSGGSTPRIVFRALAEGFANRVDWSKVHIYWGDERAVPPTDDESNYKMAFETLLGSVAIPKGQIHRIRGENAPEPEALRYSKILQEKLPMAHGLPQFDLVLLGMGDDGHTASIFPDNIKLWHAAENCVVARHPESGQQRVSITGKLINNAREVAFLVTGANKAQKVREVIRKEGGFARYPASLVAPDTGALSWYLDWEAASGLISA